MSPDIRQVYPDADVLARAAAVELLRLAREHRPAWRLHACAFWGSTPKKLYALLAKDAEFREFPWDRTQLFFGDERHVPPTHPDSNFLMTQTTLMTSGRVPEAHLHRVRAELPEAAEAAAEYETEMRAFFTAEKCLNGFPRFDAVLLGMGPDGHTASLFPGSKGLEETKRWVIANWVEKFKSDRITFTFPALNAARHVLLLVAGADKTDMLHEIFVSKSGQAAYPVQRIIPADGRKVWMLDTAANAKLAVT